MAKAIQHQVRSGIITFTVSALIALYHNDKENDRVQKPLESRYWSAVTQNIRKVAEINWKKGWNEEAGRSSLACESF